MLAKQRKAPRRRPRLLCAGERRVTSPACPKSNSGILLGDAVYRFHLAVHYGNVYYMFYTLMTAGKW
jgi:hypothetical protein